MNLKEVKLLVFVLQCNKNRWIIWCSKEYCLESKDCIWKKKEKRPHWSKTLEESKSCLIETVRLLRGLLERITKIQLRKLQQSLMTISRTQLSQKLFEKSCTKLDFSGGLWSENHIEINLFEISMFFHYFVQPLYMLG